MCRWDKTGKEQMKKRFTLILSLLCLLVTNNTTIMAQSNRTNPDKAKYFIKGNLSIEKGANGKTIYRLSQIDNSGIYFENPYATRTGEETSLEDVLFQFSRASTDYPGGINTPLDFWRYDNSINEWQPDGETRQGTAGVETKKSMVVMLVLDCSSSLGTDFNLVQGAANNFIRSLYEASQGSGSIKLGIVGFSKINETRIFNIRPLTSDSYYEMTNFINRLSTQNGTALYYAMDKSIGELMEDYCKNSIPSSEPLSAAIMVTFTDGLDQTSRNPDKNILTADNYYDEILAKYGTKMQNKTLNGIQLQHEIRGVKGNDIISDAQLGKFQRIGESLGNFKLLNNYSELGSEFEYIAKNLIDQWRILNLYVPNSFSGRVAWTYPGERLKPAQQPVNTGHKAFIGLNITFAMPMTMYYYFSQSYYDYFGIGISPKLGMDFAWPVSDKFALGFYMNAGPNFTWNDAWRVGYYGSSYATHYNIGYDVKIGLLMLAGDINNRPFIIGLAPCTGFKMTTDQTYLPLELRFGKVLGKGFYVTGNLNMGIPIDGSFMIEPGIALGWRLGKQ